jgi:hypothetical protein
MGLAGATSGGIWALVLALPHFYWLPRLAKQFGGRLERSPLFSLLVLSVGALPQALVVLALFGFSDHPEVAGVAFLLAWGSVTLGLWLPRLFL